MIVTGFVKILFFIRISESLGLLVRMVYTTIIDCLPFLAFFAMFILLFTVLNMTFMIDVPNQNEDYYFLPSFIQFLLMTYRNSIGDITIPEYQKWVDLYDEKQRDSQYHQFTIVFLVWLVWIFNQLICFIILLNFLIAVISQGYDNVVAEQVIDYY